MKKILVILILSLGLLSCTQNQKVKKYGGTATINLPQGKKLINCTWKEDNLWYLTRNMLPNETAETYELKEKSNYGVWEGTYIIVETK